MGNVSKNIEYWPEKNWWSYIESEKFSSVVVEEKNNQTILTINVTWPGDLVIKVDWVNHNNEILQNVLNDAYKQDPINWLLFDDSRVYTLPTNNKFNVLGTNYETNRSSSDIRYDVLWEIREHLNNLNVDDNRKKIIELIQTLSQKEKVLIKMYIDRKKIKENTRMKWRDILLDATIGEVGFSAVDWKNGVYNVSPNIASVIRDSKTLKKAWFSFNKKWEVIMPNWFKSPEMIRRVEKTIRYLWWLESEEAIDLKNNNKKAYYNKKADIFIELERSDIRLAKMESMDWVRTLLRYRYMNSIYQDLVKEEWYVFRKVSKSKYEIIDPKTENVITNHPYVTKLLNNKNISSFNFDFAFLSSINFRNPRFEHNWFISQKHTIAAILDKHWILNPSGTKITPENVILLNWNDESLWEMTIKKQINKKLQGDNWAEQNSIESYQELMYLKSFIEQKDYLNEWWNRDLYTELNAYKQAEWISNKLEKKFAWAKDERDLTSKITWVLSENKLAIWLVWVLLMIFWEKKWWKVLIGWALAAHLWAGVMDSVKKRVWGWFSDEDLGLIIPELMKHDLDHRYRDDYNEVSQELQKLNEVNQKHAQPKKYPALKNNQTINLIITDIAKYQINLNVDDILWKELYNKIKAEDSNIKYSQKDVEVFFKLLTSTWFIHDEDDETVLDYLTKWWQDILNRSYEPKEFTWNNVINSQIDVIFKSKWDKDEADNIKKRKSRKKLEKLINKFVYELSLTKWFLENTKKFFAWEWWTGSKKMEENTSESRINRTISKLSKNQALSDKITLILEWYKVYLKAEEKLAQYEWWFDKWLVVAEQKWYEYLSIAQENWLYKWKLELITYIEWEIVTFDKIKEGLKNRKNDEPFKSLLSRIQKLINEFEAKKIELEKLTKKSSDSSIGIQVESYNDVMKLINNDSSEFATRIRKNQTQLEELIKLSPLDIYNVGSKLDYYREAYNNQLVYLIYFNLSENQIDIAKFPYDQIHKMLTAFEKNKAKVQAKFELPLKAYYKWNKEKLDQLSRLDTSNTTLEAWLKSLSEIREYLVEKWVVISVEDEFLLRQLQDNKKSIDELVKELRRNPGKWKANPSRNDSDLLKNISDWWDDFTSYVSWTTSRGIDYVKTLDDKLLAVADRITDYLWSWEIESDVKEVLKKTKDSARGLANKITAWEWLDKELSETVKKAKATFGEDFLKDVDIEWLSLEALNKKYIEKQKALKSVASNYVKDLDVSSIDVRSSQLAITNIKSVADKLNLIRLNYPDIDISNLNNDIVLLYKNSVEVKDDNNIINAINLDISNTSIDLDLKTALELVKVSNFKISEMYKQIQHMISFKENSWEYIKRPSDEQNVLIAQLVNLSTALDSILQ